MNVDFDTVRVVIRFENGSDDPNAYRTLTTVVSTPAHSASRRLTTFRGFTYTTNRCGAGKSTLQY